MHALAVVADMDLGQLFSPSQPDDALLQALVKTVRLRPCCWSNRRVLLQALAKSVRHEPCFYCGW